MSLVRSTVKTKQKTEFGDFQTPTRLARKVCELLSNRKLQPKSLIEPTCGVGNFLFAALDQFPSITQAIGLDISSDYVQSAESKLENRADRKKVKIIERDFFHTDWPALLESLPEPILIIGNPPWITNAHLSTLNSSNVPEKSNFQKYRGFDAMTGKSNFDISEWMLIRVLHWLDNREAVMAMLCKTAVARKVLSFAWKNNISLADSAIHQIDASEYFEASVDACLLVCEFSPRAHHQTSRLYQNLDINSLVRTLGNRDGEIIASIELYERWKHLQGENKRWRSGIKHDCSKVMELVKEGDKYRNGFGDLVELEDDFIHPMLKSSEVANSSANAPRRWMLVTQKNVSDDTAVIKDVAPKTWEYLLTYAALLDQRGSSIYKKRPRFSVFGVGNYSFSPWKVVISGFYKKLCFKVVGNLAGKPIVLDDTCYFIPCETQAEAEHISSLLNSDISKQFFEAFIFWDAKRPITVEILRHLNLAALEQEINKSRNDNHLRQHDNSSQPSALSLPFMYLD